MIDNKTIFHVFKEVALRNPDGPFLIAPAKKNKELECFSFKSVLEKVVSISNIFFDKGYRTGLRVAVLLGSTPDHYILKLALNKIGVSVVPINPDYTADETSYLLEDSSAITVICGDIYIDQMTEAIAHKKLDLPLVAFDDLSSLPLFNSTAAKENRVYPETEASLLYTSGTTGRPKGCILSQNYELMCGEVYAQIGNPVGLSFGKDRILNPLPSYHINAGIVTFFGAMLTGNCLIQLKDLAFLVGGKI